MTNANKSVPLHSDFMVNCFEGKTDSDELFARLAKNLRENGSFVKKKVTYAPKTATDEQHAVGVLVSVVSNSHI